jgi:predicted metal-binding membrane protein
VDQPSPGTFALVARQPRRAVGILAFALIAWAFLAWLALDMGHPLARLTMPGSAHWRGANVLAVVVMWAVMMAAMMLPSALPMILTFVELSRRGGEPGRARAFVAAYLTIWFVFSVAAAAAQWLLQLAGWVDPMIVSTSTSLTAALLLIAGVYQFSPLKRLCLSGCRTPLGFLLGEWRPGVAGAFAMGVRHGIFCVGCCWALMALLFVGGAMNLAWVAALSIAVAFETLLPGGQRVSSLLGVALIALGFIKLLVAAGQP